MKRILAQEPWSNTPLATSAFKNWRRCRLPYAARRLVARYGVSQETSLVLCQMMYRDAE